GVYTVGRCVCRSLFLHRRKVDTSMSWNPNQGQDPNQPNQYGGYAPPQQGTPGEGQPPYGQPGSYQQPGQQPGYQQPGYQQPGGGYQQPGYQQPCGYGQQL